MVRTLCKPRNDTFGCVNNRQNDFNHFFCVVDAGGGEEGKEEWVIRKIYVEPDFVFTGPVLLYNEKSSHIGWFSLKKDAPA